MILPLVLTLALATSPPDSDCLACHGEKDIKADSGRSLYVDAARQKASVHGGLDCASCHAGITDYPHPKRIERVKCAACHDEPGTLVPKSVHGSPGEKACLSCHGLPHEIRQPGASSGAECVACHKQAVWDHERSIHAFKNGRDRPDCKSCHGSPYGIRLKSDPTSPVAKKNLAGTCGSCHANPDFLARHEIPFARPVEAYRLSVHGRAVMQGNDSAPSCSDCHGNHRILPARDAQSRINHWRVPEVCGTCHTQAHDAYVHSVHGRAVQRGVAGAPVCTDCHGEHTILAPSEPQSLVNPTRVSSVTCGRCHADERLADRYNLPKDRVPSFADSYHGLALRSGSQTVANCASCHGVHNILPASDPRSMVHPTQLARTCGNCHPGAGARFVIGPVHVRPATGSEHPVVRWIRVLYVFVLIPLTLGFMALHNAVDFLAKLIRGTSHTRSGEEVHRMNLHFRIAHGLVVLSFPVLVITGFALKFPESWWAAPLLRWEGHLAFRGLVHRMAGLLLILSIVYHVIHLATSRKDRVVLKRFLFGIKDLADVWGMLRYNLGLAVARPAFGKFSYAEKMEYWAFMWGSLVMALSGLLLWFNNFTLHWFPKWVSDASTVVHYYEAILATLAIVVWHFYMVIFDPDVYPMDRAWLTGKASSDHLLRTRPGYYGELAVAAKEVPPKADPEKG